MSVEVWRFLHLLGMAVWLGSLATLGVWTARARASGDGKIVAFTYATSFRLYRRFVAVAATLTTVAGALLTFLTGRPWFRPSPEHWLFQMQILGLAAFLLTLLYLVPNAGALARLAERAADSGEPPAEFGRRVKRQAIAGGVLAIVMVYLVLLGAVRLRGGGAQPLGHDSGDGLDGAEIESRR